MEQTLQDTQAQDQTSLTEPPISEEDKGAKRIAVVEVFGPVIQGEGPLAGSKTMFVRFGGCDYRCKMCIEGRQQVLMADYSTKCISEIQVGDQVMGVDEENRDYLSRRRMAPTTVRAVQKQGVKKTLRISTPNNSLRCTPDHELLNVKWRNYWQQAQSCKNARLISLPFGDQTRAYWDGWLDGVFAGDGCIFKFQGRWWRMKLSMHPNDIQAIEKAEALLLERGMPAHRIAHDAGNGKDLLIGTEVTNHKLVAQFYDNYLSGRPLDTDYIRGWIAGLYDTDGHMDRHTQSVRISQNLERNRWKIDRLKEYLTRLNIPFNTQQYPSRIEGHTTENVIISQLGVFFPLIRPLLRRKHPDSVSFRQIPDLPVTDIEHDNQESEVWDITTDSGNFICQGILVHNCDSLHAVIPGAVKKNARYLTAEEIADELVRLRGISGTNWVTLSGGNPCMWDLTRLIQLLKGAKFAIAVETQGTLAPEWLTKVQMLVISPKSPGMGEKFEPEKFKNILQLGWAQMPNLVVAVKVVVFSALDLEFALEVEACMESVNPPQYMHEMKFLSLGNPYPPELQEDYSVGEPLALQGGIEDPEHGRSHRERLLDHYKVMLEEFTQDGRFGSWRFLPQLHVLVYSNEAGR